MTPQRIQRKRTKGWRMPDGAIYVGRPTKWGNPFVAYPSTDGTWWVGRKIRAMTFLLAGCRHDNRDDAMADVIRRYRLMIVSEAEDLELSPADFLAELRGHDLACWCPLDRPCHADVLLDLANR